MRCKRPCRLYSGAGSALVLRRPVRPRHHRGVGGIVSRISYPCREEVSRGKMVDLKGDLAKSTIESLRDWNETLKFAGFSDNLTDSDLHSETDFCLKPKTHLSVSE